MLGALAAGPCAASSPRTSLESQVDLIFAGLDTTRSPGCALAVVRDGAAIYQRGYGMADLERNVPITPRTTFYLASVSKQFTAAAVALLEDSGRLSADDEVRKYLPELPVYAHPIRIHHLVHHTSGIRDYLGLWSLSGRGHLDSISEQDALALIARQKSLGFEPGARYSYSNSGYFLLSIIIRRVSGLTLREFAEQNLFAPLGMRHTQFHDDATRIVGERALGHFRRADGSLGLRRTTFALVGDGGLLSSVEDMVSWDRHFDDESSRPTGRPLVARQLTRRTLNDGRENDYAYGLRLGSYRGLPTVEHSGSFIGFNTNIIRFPQQHFSVVILCNLEGAGPSSLARKVADLYLADAFTEPAPQPSPRERPQAGGERATTAIDAERLRAYTGSYYSEELDAHYVVKALGQGLSFQVREGPVRPMVWEGPHHFVSPQTGLHLQFSPPVRGKAQGFTLSEPDTTGLQFIRARDAAR